MSDINANKIAFSNVTGWSSLVNELSKLEKVSKVLSETVARPRHQYCSKDVCILIDYYLSFRLLIQFLMVLSLKVLWIQNTVIYMKNPLKNTTILIILILNIWILILF